MFVGPLCCDSVVVGARLLMYFSSMICTSLERLAVDMLLVELADHIVL